MVHIPSLLWNDVLGPCYSFRTLQSMEMEFLKTRFEVSYQNVFYFHVDRSWSYVSLGRIEETSK